MKIVFFDGYCSLCSASVDWLIRIDKRNQLKFASLQGITASEWTLPRHETLDFDTVIYLKDGKRFERSAAIIEILSDIGGVWRLTRLLLVFPEGLRDLVYRLIARNRYRLLKKKEACRAPTPAERDRLLP